jgi:integral membrane protein (TIGR00529 family)
VAEIIKLLGVVGLIVFLIRKKWNLGYIMILASLLLGVLFRLKVKDIILNVVLAIIDPMTLNLFGIIILVFLLSGVLRKIESLKEIVDSLQKLVKDHRLILAFIPAFLGLIPMPAGAMFSAPMVNEVASRMNLQAEEKTFINYWFRHIWELIWPLYPSIILFSALLEVEIREIVKVQFPLTIALFIIGLVWEQRNIKRNIIENTNRKDVFFNMKKLFLGTWPILLIAVLVLFVKLDFLISLSIVILSLILLNRSKIKIKDIKDIIKSDVDLNILFLIAGIMIFQRMLEATGVIIIIPEFFTGLGIPRLVVLFIIPFLVGILTGISSATVGICFPVLLPFMVVQNEVNLNYAMFAYVGGYIGMMISPVHLCLVVTKDYFKADLAKIYKLLALPILIIILFALILVMVSA